MRQSNGTVQKRITIYDVARQAGVSTYTVSKVMKKQYDEFTEKTIHRVIQTAKTLRYVPNAMAQSLSSAKQANIVGIIGYFQSGGETQNTFLVGILDRLQQANFYSMVSNITPLIRFQWKKILHEAAKRNFISGAIFVAVPGIRKNDLDLFESCNVPVVTINQRLPGSDCIGVDELLGGRLAAVHLLSKGCRHIAYVHGPEYRTKRYYMNQRREGFLKAVAKGGHSLTAVRHYRAGQYSERDGRDIGDQILKERSDIDAVFCGAGDMTAIGLITRLREAGVRVPEDIAVVGYDDNPMAAHSTPALTTVRQPLFEMGQAAAECMLEHLQGKRDHPADKIFTPVLIARDSA